MLICDKCNKPYFKHNKETNQYEPCDCGLQVIISQVYNFLSSLELHKPRDCRYCIMECGYWKQLILKGYHIESKMDRPESCTFSVLVIGAPPHVNETQSP